MTIFGRVTYQATAALMVPGRYSLTKRQEFEREHHWRSHKVGILAEWAHTGVAAASWPIAADTGSAALRQEEPTRARVESRQSCGMSARQDTTVSGSCCCS